MLSVRLFEDNNRVAIVKFLRSQELYMDFHLLCGVGTSNPLVVQGSTILHICNYKPYMP